MNQEEQLITLKYNCLVRLGKTFFLDLIAVNFAIFINLCSLFHLLIMNYVDFVVNGFKYGFQIAKNVWLYFETNFKLLKYAVRKAINIITTNDEQRLKQLDKTDFKNQF